MAGGQQQLTSVITIRGNVDSSFSQLSQQLDAVGTTLMNIGAQINPYSQKLIRLGKESIDLYADYDDMLRKVQAVGEFNAQDMEQLDQLARQFGRTSRYTATEAAETELILAQVGLGYQEISELMPDVFRLAQAGDMSIADSADYLYSSLKSLGQGIEYADVLVDQMAKTAAVGSTDVDTLGESMTRIGSALKLFKGGSSEVLTILSAMSEFGQDMRGSEGGTALRNFMLSLAAPSGNREAVVAMLENVGSSMEELDAIMEGVDLKSAALAMKEMGLEVYDAEGNLKGGIEIITGLRDAVAGMNEETQYNTLGQIFGKRTLTTAMNLIQMTDETWMQLQADIENSDGFAQSMADIQEGGIGGALRLLNSQIKDFKLTLGDDLEPLVRSFADGVGSMTAWFSGLDDTTRANVEAVFGSIAAAGPAFLMIGGGLKLLAFAATPAGAIGLSVIGLTTLYQVMQNIHDANVTEHFGTMELDMDKLATHASGLNTEFSRAVDELSRHGAAVDTVLQSYQTATAELSGTMLTTLLTGGELTEAEQQKMMALGYEIPRLVMAGVKERSVSYDSFFTALFKDNGAVEDQDALTGILDAGSGYFAELNDRAYSLGADLREQMTAAFTDGKLTDTEREAIMSLAEDMNQAMAEVADLQQRAAVETMLYRAQHVSLDSLNEFTQMQTEARDKALAEMDSEFASQYGYAKAGYDKQIEDAQTYEERNALISERDRNLAEAENANRYRRAELGHQFDQSLAIAWDTALKESGYGELYAEVNSVVDDLLTNNGEDTEIGDKFASKVGKLGDLMTFLDRAVQQLGDRDNLNALLDYYGQSGQQAPEWLTTFERLVNTREVGNIVAGQTAAGVTSIPSEGSTDMTATHEAIQAAQQPVELSMTADMSGVNSAIAGVDGSNATVNLLGDDSDIRSKTNSGYTTSVRMKPVGGGAPMAAYAKGGRADEPSIFGDDGGEWAIPEAHTDRTADLLISAAEASGFTWSELLDRTGGLNSEPKHIPSQFIFAPTIHANDSRGVEEALENGERRMKRWWDETQSKEERVRYA